MYMISIFYVAVYQLQYSGFILENLTRGTNHTYRNLGGGGNMKTCVAVHEEGLLHIRVGGNLFKAAPSCPPPPLKIPDTVCMLVWE